MISQKLHSTVSQLNDQWVNTENEDAIELAITWHGPPWLLPHNCMSTFSPSMPELCGSPSKLCANSKILVNSPLCEADAKSFQTWSRHREVTRSSCTHRELMQEKRNILQWLFQWFSYPHQLLYWNLLYTFYCLYKLLTTLRSKPAYIYAVPGAVSLEYSEVVIF